MMLCTCRAKITPYCEVSLDSAEMPSLGSTTLPVDCVSFCRVVPLACISVVLVPIRSCRELRRRDVRELQVVMSCERQEVTGRSCESALSNQRPHCSSYSSQ